MARISPKYGPLHGNDGNTAYRTVNGITYFYTLDTEKPRRERTYLQKVNSNLIALMNRFAFQHNAELQLYFPKGKYRAPRNAFMARNKAGLAEALRPLAVRMTEGEVFSSQDLDTAVAAYAALHPDLILIGSKPGYQPIYLTGTWPTKMTFYRIVYTAITAEYEQADGTYTQVPPVTSGDDNTTQPNGGATEQVTITLTASPSNGGNVTGGGTVAKGSTVTLTATANSGFTFGRWNDGVTTAQRTVTANESITYTAQFNANAPTGGNSDD